MDENGEYENPVAFSRRLRRQCTTPELILWNELKNSKQGFKFSRQIRIGENCTVDFCCRSLKVVVELDGEVHDVSQAWDEARDAKLREAGFVVVRFRNEEVRYQIDRVLSIIREICEHRPRLRY